MKCGKKWNDLEINWQEAFLIVIDFYLKHFMDNDDD